MGMEPDWENLSDRDIPLWKKPLKIILAGWRIIFSELKWVVIRTCRQWEIRQLQKRLTREMTSLGKCIFHQTSSGTEIDIQEPETDLALKQVSFLQDEIQYLKNELSKTRQEFINKRCGNAA